MRRELGEEWSSILIPIVNKNVFNVKHTQKRKKSTEFLSKVPCDQQAQTNIGVGCMRMRSNHFVTFGNKTSI